VRKNDLRAPIVHGSRRAPYGQNTIWFGLNPIATRQRIIPHRASRKPLESRSTIGTWASPGRCCSRQPCTGVRGSGGSSRGIVTSGAGAVGNLCGGSGTWRRADPRLCHPYAAPSRVAARRPLFDKRGLSLLGDAAPPALPHFLPIWYWDLRFPAPPPLPVAQPWRQVWKVSVIK
jgi:hypothetical protein